MDNNDFNKNNNDEVINITNEKSYYTENYKQKKNNKGTIKTLALVLVVSLVSSSLVGLGLYSKFSNDLIKRTDTMSILGNKNNSTSSQLANTAASVSSSNLTVAQIAKKVGPSIIGIKITTKASNNDNFFNMFGNFGDNNSQPQVAEASGIITSNDGYIMTNYHVVQNADPKSSTANQTVMEVYFSNDKHVQAKFIGGDSYTDLAVIKVDMNNLPTATLGDSSKLNVGDPVIAIGNPLGLEFEGTVTTGVASALNRTIESDSTSQKLIQTDAAINPGNSGGALLNSNGEVIGINSIKIAQTGVEGLGFAIPINEAKPIITQLMKNGKITGRSMVGITGEDITDSIAQTYNMHTGVYVVNVVSGSGAYKAGIKKSDIIVSLAGKEIKTMQDVNNIKNNYKSGDTVDIKVIRDKNEITLKLTFSDVN